MTAPSIGGSVARLHGIDLLKAVASMCIVLHHVSVYGPLSDAFAEVAPAPAGWLHGYGRMAVQVFLVAGGFLAARAYRAGVAGSPALAIAYRYVRLAVPYAAALVLAGVGSALAGLMMADESIPERPSAAQALAHVLMLQDVLGYESLFAGAWYIAIDFQLYSVFVLLAWAAGRGALAGRVLVLGLTMASLFFFNRDSRWDVWALYFFGSYGLGAAAWWLAAPGRSPILFGAVSAVTVAALAFDFRLRIAIALAIAVVLAAGRSTGLIERWPRAGLVSFLGRISFALLLVHFPVCLLVNGIFAHCGTTAPAAVAAAFALFWVASLGLAAAFHRFVEQPLATRLLPRVPRPRG
jgi:peptidoglycan/LPS O-acetylase OafA/YrhL